MRIKGKYVALVEFEFDFEHRPTTHLPFEQIKAKIVDGDLTNEIKNVLDEEFFDDEEAKSTVTQQYADLYEVME